MDVNGAVLNTAATAKNRAVFQYRTLLPITAVLIAIVTDILIPNHAELKYAELTYYRNFLFIS